MISDNKMLFYRVLEEGDEFQRDIRDVGTKDDYDKVKGVNMLLIHKNLLRRRLISLLRS
jgi:hypothetical protein